MRTIEHHNKGFTLIEVQIAILLLTISLLSVASLAATVIRGNQISKDRAEAVQLAEEVIENMKSITYSAVASGNDTSGGFVRTWTVITNSPESKMKTVTCTVSWTRGNLNHSVELATYIGQ